MTNITQSSKRCILYYPTISIPTGRWLKQAILYWDEIGSIVPHHYDDTALVPYSSAIQHLLDEGYFRPFRPEALINQGWSRVEELEQEFKSLFESAEFQHLLNRLFIPRASQTDMKANSSFLYSRVHRDKISHELFYYLEDRGVAKRNDDSEWYQFEANTALLYMAVLAKYLADEDLQSTVPGTDFEIYERLAFQALPENEGIACLKTNFYHTLPTPREDVPLKKIVAFKQKRRAELLNFRQEIELFQQSLRACHNQAEAKEICASFSEKLERNVADIEATMRDARIAMVPSSMQTIIKLESPALWATAVVAAGKATQVANIPLDWSAIGIGVLGAIEVAKYIIDKRNEQRATLRNSPFSYLYSAKQKKILT